MVVDYAFEQICAIDYQYKQIVFTDDRLFTAVRNLMENKNGDLDKLIIKMESVSNQ